MIVLFNDKLKQRRTNKKIHVRRQFNKLINNIYNIRRDMPVYLEDCTHESNDYMLAIFYHFHHNCIKNIKVKTLILF